MGGRGSEALLETWEAGSGGGGATLDSGQDRDILVDIPLLPANVELQLRAQAGLQAWSLFW